MPLPNKFFNADMTEVSLETLCFQEPLWAANRIRELHRQYDELMEEAMKRRNYETDTE